MNRKYYMQFLQEQIESNPKGRILESCLFVALGSVEGIAALRARAIFYAKVVSPLRFFGNSDALGFSPADMGTVLDEAYDFFMKAKDDGSLLMKLDLDIFEGALDDEDNNHSYVAWNMSQRNQKSKSVDGTETVKTNHLVMSELFEHLKDEDKEYGSAKTKHYKQWLPATVAKVSGGHSDKKADTTGRVIKVKADWYLLDYDDDQSIWTGLKKGQFNCFSQGSWRLDLDEPPPEHKDDGTPSDAAGHEDIEGEDGGSQGQLSDSEAGSASATSEEDWTNDEDSIE